MDIFNVLNFLALTTYILVKELVLDKHKLKKELSESQLRKDPLKALELDFNSLKSKVVNLEDSVETQGESLNDKLDIILAEFKEKFDEHKLTLKEIKDGFVQSNLRLSERLTAVETELKLKPNRRK